MKMSTQNMSAGGEGLSFTKKNTGGDPGPLPVRSNNVFTPKEREELKGETERRKGKEKKGKREKGKNTNNLFCINDPL